MGLGGAGEVVIDARGQNGSAITIAAIGEATTGLVTRVVGVTILGGDATLGGGVLVDRAVAEIVECVIHDNRGELGGGVAVCFGDLLIERSLIEGNVAEAFGGGVYASASSLMLSETTVSGNLAGVAGGGVWAEVESIVLGEALVLCGNLPDEAAFAGDLPPEPPQACPVLGDLDGDGVVGASDLSLLMGLWGPCVQCGADLDGDGDVDGGDLSLLMSAWMAGVGGGS